MDSNVLSLELRIPADGLFDLTQAPTGYLAVHVREDMFLLAIGDVQPYLDGFKATVKVGNLMRVNYKGFALKAELGNPRRTIEKDFTGTLTSGTWTEAALTIAPATLEEIKLVDLTITVDRLNLPGY